MRFKFLFGTAIACTVAISGYNVGLSRAVQLQDGTVYFVQPPRLVEAVTTYNDIYVTGATYYFTIDIPETAGEPLQRITINQHEGVDYVHYNLKDTYAFVGDRSHKGQKLVLKDATSDRKTRTVSLTFAAPVPPGRTITIGLKPEQNPSVQGVYLLGVTAFPAGEKAYGQFLGYGRLQFYSPHTF
ncbi:MAG: DUF2808 domain-containing protein [Stigonema ocellatum SAG 48.90 = DSM 106950]|nr:DUF2808 domain-containing protein [Stigonema ocellatum SAG 48.90 = DSM 106950]